MGDLGMPYKDFQHKKEWERLHRPQRHARRRELRRIEAARREAQPETLRVQDSGGVFLLPLAVGGALAARNPKLAMGAGGVTLVVAALYKKAWSWWIVGAAILALGLFFQWTSQPKKK